MTLKIIIIKEGKPVAMATLRAMRLATFLGIG